jgi:thymidylate synthase (FAD)
MRVVLLAHTENPDDLAEVAARSCYSINEPSSIKPTEEKKALKRAIDSGHLSVLEHVSFTFSIEGVSRTCTHQLVRHRMASYSQQSQRYVKTCGFVEMVIPDSVKGVDAQLDDMMRMWKGITDELLKKMDSKGIPQEDVRYFFPQGTATNIVVTMNARELLHFFELRCCNRAQWEIRNVANSMLNICKEISPLIFEKAGPPCLRGECKEVEKCKT